MEPRLKACIDNRKNLLNSNISCMSHNMANFSPLTAEITSVVWGTQQISTVFASWLRYCSDAPRKPTKMCMMFGRLLGWYTIYTFSGVLAPMGISPGAKFTLYPSRALSYICSVTAQHSSSGRQLNLAAWYTEWNY